MKNIIGRAGRAGKETRGRVIFITATEKHRIKQILENQGMESAKGFLFRIIEVIIEYAKNNSVDINDILNFEDPVIQTLLENVDYSILDLLPENVVEDAIPELIAELLEKTLAKHQSESDEFLDCLQTIFRLRAGELINKTNETTRSLLKKSGASLGFLEFIEGLQILDNPLWINLADPLDEQWISEIIQPLLNYPQMEIETEHDLLINILRGWMNGKTYNEIAETCNIDIDEVFEIICVQIGYRLQNYFSKLCQLALVRNGEEKISYIAQAWSSFLQFGLSTLQQLDLFERGISDRMAVWGVHRGLEFNNVDLRGVQLINYIKRYKTEFREILESDNRVPQLCINRFVEELEN